MAGFSRCWRRHDQTTLIGVPERRPVGRTGDFASLLGRAGVAKDGSIVPEFRYFLIVLRDRPVRRAISRIGSFSRSRSFRIMFKSHMWITP